MGEKDYFDRLAQLQKRLKQELEETEDLPENLRPEGQEVSEEIRARAESLRDAVLNGNRDAVSNICKTAGAGFYRAKEESEDEGSEDDAELDEARERVKKRLQRKSERSDEPGNGDSKSDPS